MARDRFLKYLIHETEYYLPNFCLIRVANIFTSGNLNCMATIANKAKATRVDKLNCTNNNNKLLSPINLAHPQLTPQLPQPAKKLAKSKPNKSNPHLSKGKPRKR